MDPKYFLAYFNAANLYFSQSRWEQALDFYNLTLSLEINDVSAVLNRGITKAMLSGINPSPKKLMIYLLKM